MGAELDKLEANLGGVSTMKRQPDAVFIVDLRKEQLALREAQRLGLPVIALVDTNCDPDEVSYVVPGNDDAIRSCSLVIRAVADGIEAGKTKVTEAEIAAAPAQESPRPPPSPTPQSRPRSQRTRARRATSLLPSRTEPRLDRRRGDQRLPRQGAPRGDGRRDDGLQARARRDGRRPRGGEDAPAREGEWRRPASGPTARRPRASSASSSSRGTASIVGLGCETEPVSKNDAFQAFGEKVLRAVHADGPTAAERFDAERAELIAQLGENIVIVGADRFEGGTLAAYVHPPANKIGVVVKLEGGTEELARQVAMHVSFAAPLYTARADVPAEVVDAERQIYLNSDELASKPEQAREKIVDGMLAKRFFAAAPGGVLLEQAWIHDASTTVGKALEEAGASVTAFARVSVAGS